MDRSRLDNLVRIGQLKEEAPVQDEFMGLLHLGKARLTDAGNDALSTESRFDLAYNAAHSLSLAAMRWHGYRPDSRYHVFQCLTHTLDLSSEQWRVLDQAHRKRNLAEYEGTLDIDDALLSALLRVTRDVLERVEALGPIAE